MTSDTEKLLEERARTHGEYREHARITQGIMNIIMSTRNWVRLSPIQRESLHMFAHKIGRICEGDPNHPDHWDDISGYAVLVSQRLVTDAPKTGYSTAEEARAYLGRGAWGDEKGYPPIKVHAVGDPDPVPVEDSNRHADRAPRLRKCLTRWEFDQLPVNEQSQYQWDEMRQEWYLK